MGVANIPYPDGGGCAQQNATLHLSYNSLPDLFINENIYITQATYLDGDVYYDPPIRLINEYLMFTTVEELVNKFTWEILGRMCHLLQDMSVPTHAHGDAHNLCDDGINYDTYETWVGAGVAPYNSPYLSISHNGMSGFLNPIGKDKPLYYLMYRVQQVADHFGSNGPYNGDGNDYLPVTTPSYYNIPLYTLPSSPTSVNDFACCTDLAGELCYNRDGTSLQNRINIRDATLPLAISGTAGILYWFAVETGLITNIVVQNNFTGGTVKVNTVVRNSPYDYSNIVGLLLSLEAVTPQNGSDGYQHIWNNFAPNARSLWQILKGSSTYDILPPNIQHNFVTTQADNKATYLAGLRKNYKIDVDHQTEFNGLQADQLVKYIVEQNSDQISAPVLSPLNPAYCFAGWTDGNSQNSRTITPTDNATYTALYKIPSKSNNQYAFSSNSQKKLVKTSDGILHKVYSSMGRVWYEKSTDNGVTWTIENYGQPLSSNESKLPAIDISSSSNEIIIVWQEKYNETYKIRLAHYSRPGPNLVFHDVYNDAVYYPTTSYSHDAMPVISWGDNKILVVWKEGGLLFI
ncbi:MAG: hypothetical protein HXY50_07580 [Ignavibacteriaceae bacterium]|nr:hypothetical protein [Ignavibacteriaceae bacterium]